MENVGDVEELLRSDAVSARDLHAIWARRRPLPHAERSDKADDGGHQIAWLQQDLRLASRFTRRALEKEEFLLVADAAREILNLDPSEHGDEVELVRVRMHYAAALTRLGLTRDARTVVECCLDEGFRPRLGRRLKFEVLLQLGDIVREESSHAAARAVQLNTGEEALQFYRRALELEPTDLGALTRTASAAFFLGEEGSALRTEAHDIARRVIEVVKGIEDDQGPNFESTWSRGTARAVLGDVDAAMRAFAELRSIEHVTTAKLAERRYWTRFLAEALQKPADLFAPAFPLLQLIVFAGHLPDRPGEPPRLPASSIPAVRDALREELERIDARVGLVSGSAGADLLFIEALRDRGGTVHLVLPWSQGEFRRTSVEPYENPEAPSWTPLFDRALAEAATIREIGQVYEPSTDVGWEYMTEVTAGIALHTARASRLDIQPMVLWDGKPARGPGGTASFDAFWRHHLQRPPIVVRTPAVSGGDGDGMEHATVHLGRARRSERSTTHQEVKSMLFADIVGYSKLTEKVIPEFVSVFLDRVSRLVASSQHAPCSVNTWGDAVYGVFDYARDAALFSIELAQLVEEGRPDWMRAGLYWDAPNGESRPLSIRIGLHAGPVVMHYDPVVRRLGYTGSHVSRAARIEPVTRPGDVFASEEFAALAELAGEVERQRRSAPAVGDDAEVEEGFACEYAGTMALAKGYPGRYRIYRVVPKRTLVIEHLARAVHEAYCEESRARGDTPKTNSSMRPWAELGEDLRQANRLNVADIPNKLRELGWELAPSHGVSPSEIVMTDDEVGRLAQREHERWMAERRKSGWTYAPRRDNARKHHDLLVAWSDLTEPNKDRSRNTVRNLPKLVERAGFRVRRIR